MKWERLFLPALALLTCSSQLARNSANSTLQEKCSCRAEGVWNRDYEGPPSEDGGFSPHVIGISEAAGTEVIDVAFDVMNKTKGLNRRTLSTKDGGHTWVTKSTRSVDAREFWQGDVGYEIPLAGGRLDRSFNAGIKWEPAAMRVNGMTSREFAQHATGTEESSLEFQIAAVHPRNPRTVFACFTVGTASNTEYAGMYVSTDGGDNWKLFSRGAKEPGPDESCVLGISPSNPNLMVTHGPTGPVISRDAGITWAAVGQQSALEAPVSLKEQGVSPSGTTNASGQDVDRSFEWKSLKLAQIEFDPNQENTIYLVSNKGLFASFDGANHWCLVRLPTTALFDTESLYIDRLDSSTLFLGTREKLFVSRDFGCHFKLFFNPRLNGLPFPR